MHLHWHRLVHETSQWGYYECRCGRRKARGGGGRGYQPLDKWWLNGGDWDRPIYPPPMPSNWPG